MDWRLREKALNDLLDLPKIERIRLMQKWGLNTIDYVYIPRGSTKDELYEAFRKNYLGKKVSIRCYCDSEDLQMGKPPVYPSDESYTQLLRAEELVRRYNLMLDFDPADPIDSVYAGTLHMEQHSIDGVVFCEFRIIKGPGIVRDIEHRGETIVCNLRETPRDHDGYHPELSKVKLNLIKFPYWNGLIYEFSVYPYPIGIQRKTHLFWEVRKYK